MWRLVILAAIACGDSGGGAEIDAASCTKQWTVVERPGGSARVHDGKLKLSANANPPSDIAVEVFKAYGEHFDVEFIGLGFAPTDDLGRAGAFVRSASAPMDMVVAEVDRYGVIQVAQLPAGPTMMLDTRGSHLSEMRFMRVAGSMAVSATADALENETVRIDLTFAAPDVEVGVHAAGGTAELAGLTNDVFDCDSLF